MKPNFKKIPSNNILPYVSYRIYRSLHLSYCKRKIRIDAFLISKFFSLLITDKLCYLTVWFSRSSKIIPWLRKDLLRVYRGKKWKGLRVAYLQKGQCMGVFARTKVLAVFQQSKTKKKKSKTTVLNKTLSFSNARLEKAKKFKGKTSRPLQGVRILNKTFIGSRWLKNIEQDQSNVVE